MKMSAPGFEYGFVWFLNPGVFVFIYNHMWGRVMMHIKYHSVETGGKTVSCLVWMGGTELWSSASACIQPTAISPALPPLFWFLETGFSAALASVLEVAL